MVLVLIPGTGACCEAATGQCPCGICESIETFWQAVAAVGGEVGEMAMAIAKVLFVHRANARIRLQTTPQQPPASRIILADKDGNEVSGTTYSVLDCSSPEELASIVHLGHWLCVRALEVTKDRKDKDKLETDTDELYSIGVIQDILVSSNVPILRMQLGPGWLLHKLGHMNRTQLEKASQPGKELAGILKDCPAGILALRQLFHNVQFAVGSAENISKGMRLQITFPPPSLQENDIVHSSTVLPNFSFFYIVMCV